MDTKKIRVMFYNDGINKTSGYGRVVKQLATRLAKDDKYEVYSQDILDYAPLDVIDKVIRVPSFGQRGDMNGPFLYSIMNNIRTFQPHVIIPVCDAFLLVRDGLNKIDYKNIKLIPYIPIDSNVLPDTSNKILDKADKILVQSEFGKQELLKDGYESEVFRHGVNFNVFKEDLPNTKNKFGIEEDTCVFLFIGRNTLRKRIHHLIRGFANFIRDSKDKNSILLMHGSNLKQVPHDMHSFIAHESKRVGFDLMNYIVIPYEEHNLGQGVTEQDIVDLYTACDWTISAASGEGTGLMSLEGFACGKPTIYPKNSNWKEIIGENNERGLVVNSVGETFVGYNCSQPIVDINSMSEEIDNAYNYFKQKEVYNEMSKNAVKWIKENGNWDKIVEELKSYIEEVL